ncbi:MAG: hypothetical protein HPY53_11125 [Brevinematales bacterium]|nr:hypothetical protein [Brevinematales bacterium]
MKRIVWVILFSIVLGPFAWTDELLDEPELIEYQVLEENPLAYVFAAKISGKMETQGYTEAIVTGFIIQEYDNGNDLVYLENLIYRDKNGNPVSLEVAIYIMLPNQGETNIGLTAVLENSLKINLKDKKTALAIKED